MNLLAISVNHHTAPVDLRESLHLSTDEIKELLNGLKNEYFSEGFIISTCNRTEIYGIPINPGLQHTDLEKYLTGKKPVGKIEDAHFQKFFACSAVQHVFKVAAGIDSLLIGDNQILGQVKESFQIAEGQQFVGFMMKRLFDSAIKVGKRVKTETTISEGAITVSYAAVQLIEKIFSNLSKKSALVIGLGETGEIAAKHLRDKDISKLTLTNRTYEKAEKAAEKLGAAILPFGNFKEHLHEFDIIISATSSPELILTFDDIKQMMKRRGGNPSILMDIAIPRDISPDARKLDNVFYNDIDSLNIIVEQNMKKRRDEIPKVKAIIMDEMVDFYNWFNSLEVAPTIKSLREFFEEIRQEEVKNQINRFSENDREKLEIITKRIINKILHHPTMELRRVAESGVNSPEAAAKIAIIRELFGIDKKG
ncbi:MAG: glutamyl-tRNA reductase [Ignavibacteriales bacterium]|nr:glutamyl-tRNA reductase [Ignavibacteriales bacterium]